MTGTTPAPVSFTPLGVNPDFGTLELPIDGTIMVVDGRHRTAAIERALEIDPDVGDKILITALLPCAEDDDASS